MGPHEPYWRTNSSYSPPPSRWDFRLQSEGLSFGSHDGIQLFGSSASSNSRESRSWLRGNHLPNHQYMVSDGGPYYSSPSEISPVEQSTPPIIQEISVDDHIASSRGFRPLSFSPAMEGASAARDSGSASSRSDSSEYESIAKTNHAHRSISSRRSFMSKPVHPLSCPSDTYGLETTSINLSGNLEFDAITQLREKRRLSSASGSADLTDISESFEAVSSQKPRNPSDSIRCGLCERLLSQRSPWSSRRIVRSGDMPVAGVLSCCHVFHAECLDQTTPKACKSDPPCPICVKFEEDNSPDQRSFSKFFPRFKPFCEDGPSKPWSCAHAGDCVEGALRGPSRSTLLSFNRGRIRNNLSLKGGQGKEFPGKARKSSSFASQLLNGSNEHGLVGPSRITSGGILK